MKKRLILILLALILVSVAAGFYINRVFLPVHLKQIIVDRAQDYLKRKVTFKDIHFNVIQGFSISDLTIFEKGSSDTPFIHFDNATFRLLYTPIVKERKIVIPSITIDKPLIHIARDENKEWNFGDLLARRKTPQPAPTAAKTNAKTAPSFTFLLGSAHINGGRIEFSDNSFSTPIQETVEDINFKTSLSLKKGATFNFTASLPQSASLASADGEFDIATRKVTARVDLENIPLDKYLSLYYTNPRFILKKGQIETASADVTFENRVITATGFLRSPEFDIIVQTNKEITGSLKTTETVLKADLNERVFELQSDVDLGHAEMVLSPERKLSGNVKAGSLTFSRRGTKADITAQLTAENAVLAFGNTLIESTAIKTRKTDITVDLGAVTLKSDLESTAARVLVAPDKEFKGTLTSPEFNLTYKDGRAAIDGDAELKAADLKFPSGRTLTGDIKASNTKLIVYNGTTDVETNLALDNAVMVSGPQILSGHPSLVLRVLYDPSHTVRVRYNGKMDCNQLSVKGVPYIDEANALDGTIVFDTGRFEFDPLRLTALNSPIVLSGNVSVSDLAQPAVDIKASGSQIDLGKWIKVAPAEFLKKSQITAAGGNADVDLVYKGTLGQAAEAQITAAAEFKDATLTSAKVPAPIEGITGKMRYSKDALTWEDLAGTFQGKNYTLNGDLLNFARPVLKTSLSSTDLNLKANVNILNDAFQIMSLTGKYYNSDFDAKGDVNLVENSGPRLNIMAKGSLDLGDIAMIIPSQKEQMEKLKPSGSVSVTTVFKGDVKDWKNWDLNVVASSPSVSLAGYKAQKLSARFDQRDQNINKCDITGEIYGGAFKLSSGADLMEDQMPFRLTAQLDNTDLSKLKDDSTFKERDISGILTAYLALAGHLSDYKKAEGTGQIAVTDGHLWQMNLFKGLGKLLLIPEYQDIVFTAASSNFKIKNERATTNDLELISQAVTLKGGGWVDLQGNINFDIVSEFSPQMIEQSRSIKRTVTTVLAQTNNYLSVKVSGTLKDPKYMVLPPSPINVLEKTRDMIKDGLDSIF